MLTDNEYRLAEQVIKLHDGKHYQTLKEISRLPEEGSEDDPISDTLRCVRTLRMRWVASSRFS
jgi:hypothetical protein